MTTLAKRVDVSGDGGTVWHTLPGGTGSFTDEGSAINDTIFGSTFQSNQPGLITWSSNSQALYKGFAGYVASIKKSGTPTTITDEETTLLSGKTYQVTNAAKRILDRNTAVTVKDGGVAVDAANIVSINYLFGRVTFKNTYTPGGAITIDGKYLPTTEVAGANDFTLTQRAAVIDKTDFATARGNGGYRVSEPGLRTVSLQVGGFYKASSAFWTLLEQRAEVIIEVNPDGSGLSLCRGFFKLQNRSQSGNVGAQEEETKTFELSVPEGINTVFDWVHDNSSTLSAAIRVVLDSWLNQELLDLRYLPEGEDEVGMQGQAIVTDVSLKSGLEAMNEFTANFQGSGSPDRGVQSD